MRFLRDSNARSSQPTDEGTENNNNHLKNMELLKIVMCRRATAIWMMTSQESLSSVSFEETGIPHVACPHAMTR